MSRLSNVNIELLLNMLMMFDVWLTYLDLFKNSTQLSTDDNGGILVSSCTSHVRGIFEEG